MKDFQHKSCGRANAKCKDSPAFLVLVDKGIAEHLNDSPADFNRYAAGRGLTSMRNKFTTMAGHSADEANPVSPMYLCDGDTNGSHDFHNTLEFPLRDSHSGSSGPGSVISDIDADFKVETDAEVFYSFGSTLCVPHKLALKKIDASAKYQIKGDIDVHGKVSGRIPTFDWHSYIGNLGSGIFMAGPFPVEYDLRLPVSAGVGDIIYQANGDVGLKKQLEVDGDFKFECTLDSCMRISSSYDDHGLIQPGDIKYTLMAEISIEPYVNVEIDADIYKRLIWAQAGASAKLPMSIIGYYGNTCGNGDGLGQEETVAAGLINVDLNVNAYAKGNRFSDKYWPVVDKNLFFTDLVKPSTAMSPIVRPSVKGQQVDLLVALRSCVSQVPSSYQNYIINWGDGTSEDISQMNNSEDILHNYAEKGNYTVNVKHKSGPSTTVQVKI